ncbi:MAG: hypothetical protein ACYTG5_13395 [Planctomycetota bacterium]|jgi:hypothetical protein
MHRPTKIFAIVGVLASLSLLTAFVGTPAQDPEQKRDPFYQSTRLNFAVLQVTNAAGKATDIPASTISKIWLIADSDGDLRMELSYENGDYSSLELHDFHIIRRSSNLASVDVPVVRTDMSGLAFPSFKD